MSSSIHCMDAKKLCINDKGTGFVTVSDKDTSSLWLGFCNPYVNVNDERGNICLNHSPSLVILFAFGFKLWKQRKTKKGLWTQTYSIKNRRYQKVPQPIWRTKTYLFQNTLSWHLKHRHCSGVKLVLNFKKANWKMFGLKTNCLDWIARETFNRRKVKARNDLITNCFTTIPCDNLPQVSA